MKTSTELRQAVEAYQNGETEKFNEVYELSSRYLYTCIIHVVKNEDAAQDMLQETYIEVVKNIHQLKSAEDFLSWAAVIANRKCFAYLKKQRDVVLNDSGSEEENETDYFENLADDVAMIPEEIMQDKEKQRLIREIIDGLTEMQRLCVIGFYYNEQSQESIATELGIPVNTVKSHLNRAKGKIKEGVEELNVKKGTKLYTIAPFMFLLFTEEAKACEAPKMSEEVRKLALDGKGNSIGADGGTSKGMKPGKKKLITGTAICMVAAGVATTMYVASQNKEQEAVNIQQETEGDMTEEVITPTPEVTVTVTPTLTVTPTPEPTATEVPAEPLDFQEAMGEIEASRQYDKVIGAKGGLLVVSKDEKCGLVTYDNQIVVPLEYEFACSTPNNEGQTFFGNDGDYKVFDKDGKEIFQTSKNISSVSDGVVLIEELEEAADVYKYEYVKLDGTVLHTSKEYPASDYQVFKAVGFQEGYGLYYSGDEKMISAEGNEVEIFMVRCGEADMEEAKGSSTIEFNGGGMSACFTHPVGAIHQGYYVSQGNRVGPNPYAYHLFDTQGNEGRILNLNSLCTYAGHTGAYSWQLNGINMEGNMCFSYNTIMSVSLTIEEETKTYLIDLAKVGRDLDEAGNPLTTFPEGSILAEGEYIGISDETYWLYSADGKWGYIDHEGNVKATFDDASAFVNGKAMVIIDGQAHFIDEQFNVSEESVPADSVATIGEVFQITTGSEKIIVH